jgi:Leucine-rich repeat (LRR) protein
MRLLNIPLIALFLPFVICYSQNITLECNEACDDEKYCELFCNLPDGLKPDYLTEVASLSIHNEQKRSKYEQIPKHLQINSMIRNIPQSIGSKVSNLEKFTVTSSILRYIKQSDFQSMSSLKILDLSHNQIENFPHDTFQNLTKLEILSINDNQIDYLHIDTLKNLPNLREFYAQYNQIQRLDAHFFKHNTKLARIYLNNNDLVSIHEDFLKLLDLVVVDLRDNAEYCRNCGVMKKEASIARFNECYRDRHDAQKSTKENFEICVNKKISEREDLGKLLDFCIDTKRNHTEQMNSTFKSCIPTIKGENRVSFDTLRKIETCMLDFFHTEARILENYVSCTNDKSSKSKDLVTLISDCKMDLTTGLRKVNDNFVSCQFCEKMNDAENVKKCELRFMLAYDDKIEDFQADVNKFFRTN